MTYLAWQNSLNTGIQVIDDQHKRIVDMINLLHQAQTQGQGRSEVDNVLNELVDYTLSHFAFEESLLEEAGYEFTRPHKRVHAIFVTRVSEYRQRFQEGEDITEELLGLLSRWLFNHIRNDDAAYAQAVKASMNALTTDKRGDGWFSRSLKKFFG